MSLVVNFDHVYFKMHYDQQNSKGLFSDENKKAKEIILLLANQHLQVHFIYKHSVETETIFNISIILAFERFYLSR